MKPLNHKERTKSIWAFFISLLPVIVFIPTFLFLFSISAKEHERFVKKKYETAEDYYKEQAQNYVKIDSLLSIIGTIVDVNENVTENLFKQRLRLADNIIGSFPKNMSEDDPYTETLAGIKEILISMDTVFENKKEHSRLSRKLWKIIESYQNFLRD